MTVTTVAASDSLSTIQAKLNAVPAGGSLVFPPMTIPGPLKGKSGITLWADGLVVLGGSFNFDGLSGWTVRGRAPGQGFKFSGDYRLLANNAADWAVGNCKFADITSGGWNGSAVAANGAKRGLVINNKFVRCAGNVVGMYDLDNVTFDGNWFTGCWQPFSIQTPTSTNTSLGRNLVWRRNIFLATQRACIEVGPSSSGAEYFSGIVVEGNYFDDFDCRCAPGEMLPVSLVGQAAENTLVKGNFIRKGSRPSVNTPEFEWTVGTEFTGSGEMTGNTICGFRYNLLYQSGWVVRNNILFGTPYNFSINQAGATGTRSNNVIAPAEPATPAQPARIDW